MVHAEAFWSACDLRLFAVISNRWTIEWFDLLSFVYIFMPGYVLTNKCTTKFSFFGEIVVFVVCIWQFCHQFPSQFREQFIEFDLSILFDRVWYLMVFHVQIQKCHQLTTSRNVFQRQIYCWTNWFIEHAFRFFICLIWSEQCAVTICTLHSISIFSSLGVWFCAAHITLEKKSAFEKYFKSIEVLTLNRNWCRWKNIHICHFGIRLRFDLGYPEKIIRIRDINKCFKSLVMTFKNNENAEETLVDIKLSYWNVVCFDTVIDIQAASMSNAFSTQQFTILIKY